MILFFKNSVFVICNKCIGTNKFFGFLVWGRVSGWWLKSQGGASCVEAPLFKFCRIYSLGLKHFCAGGGG